MSTVEESFSNEKRKNYINWGDYFMGIALLAAQRSKDPRRQVGSCIVNEENKIVGIGYNGFPRGCSDDEFPWSKNKHEKLLCKLTYVCHAEMNAIMNTNHRDTKGCTLYVTLFPCNECAKIIIQAGIKTVIYNTLKSSDKTTAAIKMFNAAGIIWKSFTPKKRKIVIDFKKSPDHEDSATEELIPAPSPPKQTRRNQTEDEAENNTIATATTCDLPEAAETVLHV